MSRAYDNSRRADAAARTTERIAAATEQLLASRPLADITLQAIAQGADVSVQTVLRHMGSRDGCFLAAGERLEARIDAQRGHSAPGDVDSALDGLVEHYEADGRLVLTLLSQETGDPLALEAARRGRAYHRAWVQRCFGPDLDEPTTDALVAATDLYIWKLLRLDLGRSVDSTRATLGRLVRAVLETP